MGFVIYSFKIIEGDVVLIMVALALPLRFPSFLV